MFSDTLCGVFHSDESYPIPSLQHRKYDVQSNIQPHPYEINNILNLLGWARLVIAYLLQVVKVPRQTFCVSIRSVQEYSSESLILQGIDV